MKAGIKPFVVACAATLLVAGVYVFAWPGNSPGSGTAPSVPDASSIVSLTDPVHETWPLTLQANGPLAAWQEAIVGVESASLRITELHADVGSVVKKGQVLARLADAGLKADQRKQEAAVAQARANLAQAQANMRRVRTVGTGGALSGQKIEEYALTEATTTAEVASAEAELQSTRIRLGQTTVVASDDGIVSSRTAMLGNVVGAGAELFRLVRQGRVEWHAELDAQQVGRVKAGQLARISLPGGAEVEGRVRLIGPTLNANTGRATVYVSLPAGSGAQPGMFASGLIEGEATPALTLPASAVVLRDGRSDVYVLENGDTVRRATVITGRRQGNRVEVLSGLQATARVVSMGGAFLSDGAAVRSSSPDGTASPDDARAPFKTSEAGGASVAGTR